MDDAGCKPPCTMECSPDAWPNGSRWRWESVSKPCIDQSWNNLSDSEKFSRQISSLSPEFKSVIQRRPLATPLPTNILQIS